MQEIGLLLFYSIYFKEGKIKEVLINKEKLLLNVMEPLLHYIKLVYNGKNKEMRGILI